MNSQSSLSGLNSADYCCKCISFSFIIHAKANPDYCLNNVPLQQAQFPRDLDILTDCKPAFSVHTVYNKVIPSNKGTFFFLTGLDSIFYYVIVKYQTI